MSEAASTQGIPDGWSIRAVRDVGDVIAGKALAATAPGRTRPYLRTKNVFDGRVLVDDVLSMPMTEEQFETFRLRHGDVLLNEGQSLELVGRCAIYADEYPVPCAIQNALLRFRAKSNVSALFASYVFRHCQHTGVFARIALQTTSVAHLGVSRFADLKLPWPQTETEQRAIATALSDVDALITGLEKLIAKKRDLKQAAMQQLLTGQTRLPGFNGEWASAELKRLVSTPITDGPHMTPRFYDSGVPFLSVNNLANNQIDLTDLRYISKEDDEIFARKCKPRKGDVLLGKAASVGKVAIVEDDFDFNIWSPIALARPHDQMHAKFLYYQLLSADCIGQIMLLTNASSQGNIGMGDIEKIQISYPDLKEQQAIASVLSDMDIDLTTTESRLTKTRALKQGMMQELLTGRTRLV